MTDSSPRLSILVLAYNQEHFLAQALAGVEQQRVDFPFELVVADDCSVDGTATVLEQWRGAFGARMRVLPRSKNLGISRNFVDALANCRGQYVAILEGDDYWTDSRKLQMQHDFLAANPDYSACFHRVKLQLDDGRIIDWTPLPGSKPRMEFREVLVENFVPGCSSLMFRNDPRLTFPDWLFEVNYYDWLLNVANAELGALRFLDETMSVYRVHANGAWSGRPIHEQVRAVCDILEHLNQHYDGKYEQLIRVHQCNWQHRLTIRLLQDELQALQSGGPGRHAAFLPARVLRRLRSGVKKLVYRALRRAA